MSVVSNNGGSNHHNNNGWTPRAEKLVRYWQEECRLYSWIYECNATYYSRLNRSLGVMSIILSALTGTTLFNQSADSSATSSGILIGLGVSSIASTVLSGLKELLDLNTLITNNTNAARENTSIVMDIDEQLNMERVDRKEGRDFLKSIKDRKNDLVQNGPIIPSRQWKDVHKKIQSKGNLGFLNRDVFNEYLEQSIDINRLNFNGSIDNSPSHQYDYSNSNNINTQYTTYNTNTQYNTNNQYGGNDVKNQEHNITKKSTLQEKINYYSGGRLLLSIIIPSNDDEYQTIEKDLENITQRGNIRKDILENHYELEKLLSKQGELKNKERTYINELRSKMRELMDNYVKLNTGLVNHMDLINMDIYRVSNIISGYHANIINDNELYRIIQIDLVEIDKETFDELLRTKEILTMYRNRSQNIDSQPSLQTSLQSSLHIEPNHINNAITDVKSSITPVNISLSPNSKIPIPITEYSNNNIHINSINNSNYNNEDNIITQVSAINDFNTESNIKLKETNEPLTETVIDIPEKNNKYGNNNSSNGINKPTNENNSNIPQQSDDDFIDSLMSGNLCSQQLHNKIQLQPSNNNVGNENKSPSKVGRRKSITSSSPLTLTSSNKYDAQMRYQSSRFM